MKRETSAEIANKKAAWRVARRLESN